MVYLLVSLWLLEIIGYWLQMPTAHFQSCFCRCIIGEDRQITDPIMCDFAAKQAISVSNRSELTKCQLLYFAVTQRYFFSLLLSLLQNQKVIVHFWNAQFWRNLSFYSDNDDQWFSTHLQRVITVYKFLSDWKMTA